MTRQLEGPDENESVSDMPDPGAPNLSALWSQLHEPEFAAELISPVIGPRKRLPLTCAQRRAIYDYWGGIDWYTGLPLPFEEMHLDHVIPFSRGGSDAVENLRPTLVSFNRARGTDLQPLAKRQLGAIPGPDGFWIPDADQALAWHDGFFYTVPRFRTSHMVRNSACAGAGAVVLDAALQGVNVVRGRQHGFDANGLAETAGQAATTAAVAYAFRIALRRVLPHVDARGIDSVAGFAAAVVIGGVWATGKQGVAIVRRQRDGWDVELIARETVAPVTDLAALPRSAWRLSKRPARSAQVASTPEPEPGARSERESVSDEDGTRLPARPRRLSLAPVAAVLAPALPIAAVLIPLLAARLAPAARVCLAKVTR